jgi:flagellar hook-associated protein 1 FlgK
MSLSGILNVSITGLTTSQEAMRTASVNIANVNTEGYVRKIADQKTRVLASSAGGVEIAEIRRNIDTFLEREALFATSNKKRFEAQNKIQDSLQAALGKPDLETSMAARLNKIFAGLADLQIEPDSAVRRFAAVNDLNAWGQEVERVATEIQSYRSDADRRISDNIGVINSAIDRISDLSIEISKAQAVGQDASALEEERARQISKISELVDVRVVEIGGGYIDVSTTSGVSLVDRVKRRLVYQPTSVVNSSSQISQIKVYRVDPASGSLSTNFYNLDPSLTGGEIRGLMDMRDTYLPYAALQLGEMSRKVVAQLNSIHNDNVAYPPPTNLTGRNTGLLGTDNHDFTGAVSFVLMDTGNGTVRRTVTADFSANTYTVNGGAAVAFGGTTLTSALTAINTGLGTNGAFVFTNGTLSYTNGTAGALGIGMIQNTTSPSSRGGRGFSHFFGLNNLMTATTLESYNTGFAASDAHGFNASGSITFEVRGPNNEVPTTFSITPTAGGNVTNLAAQFNASFNPTYGSVSYNTTSGQFDFTFNSTYSSYKVNVTGDTTTRGATGVTVSDMFGIGDKYRANAALGLAVASRIGGTSTSSGNINLFSSGNVQSLTVGAVGTGPGDNSGVRDLVAASATNVSFAAAGDLSAATSTMGEYVGNVFQRLAINASTAKSFEDHRTALLEELNNRRNAVSGVNLDEELSNTIIFQNAYNAAARMMTTARDMFDELLRIP